MLRIIPCSKSSPNNSPPRDPLADEQVRQAVEQLADEKIPAAVKADFLTALAQKGETPDEIAAFARALRDKSIPPPLDADLAGRPGNSRRRRHRRRPA